MGKRKVVVSGEIKVRAYDVTMRALEEGIRMGVARWLRKGNAPENISDEMCESLQEHLDRSISDSLCEVLTFGDEP